MKFVEKTEIDGVFLSSQLQQGVLVEFLPGETVRTFVLRVLTLHEKSMGSEIKTIFLNNSVIDDPGSSSLVSGDTLVLSGAMPGLVGAMLRCDSPIKALRETISGSVKRRESSLRGNMIRLKLFNSVLSDHKKDLLETGFFLESED